MNENNSNENNTNLPKKKTKLIGIACLLLIIIIGIGIGYSKYNSTKNVAPQIDADESKCEILDKSVLLSTDALKEWNDEHKDTKQTSTTTDDNYTYALITYGKTTEPDVGICLEKVEYTDTITISYSIMKGKSTEQVAEYTPEMFFRFKNNNLKINFKDITEEKQEKEKEKEQEQVSAPAEQPNQDDQK